jgi:hypothetical protein
MTGWEMPTRASKMLKGPMIDGSAWKPKTARLMTVRRWLRVEETSGSRSSSACQRAPRACVTFASWSSSPRLYCRPRLTASLSDSASGCGVGGPGGGALPENGLAGV